MKTLLITTLLVLTSSFNLAQAHEPGGKAGPTAGKLITEVAPNAEFFVNKDRKVEIRFISDKNKVIAPGEQVVSVVLGDRSAPTKLAFIKDGNKLVSDKAIPAGNEMPTVVQIKAKAGEKTVSKKFNLNLSSCPTCKNAEYACICGH
ncbi:MAG: hypothetical protein JWO89_2978 [Verrucomicrobiaceae bacterium]|nr:hypothetical protein [Verrucomicrobiaceae bacterium]